MSLPIYLDHQATTPLNSQVLAAMQPYLTDLFGNAASTTHAYGWEAKEATIKAQKFIADKLNLETPEHLLFTSGTTESNNMVIQGLVAANQNKNIHLITQKTEHESVLDVFRYVENFKNVNCTYLDVDEYGLVNVNELKEAIRPETILISIMFANNEIGTIQPIQEIGNILKNNPKIFFHVDAAQAVGKLNINFKNLNIDALSFSGHKIYGPKGVGGLALSTKVTKEKLYPLIHGGGHQNGWRSGTLNVPGIVGLAKALEICLENIDSENKRLINIRDQMGHELTSRIEYCHINGHNTQRLAGNLNLSFKFIKSHEILTAMPGFAISSGSACASDSTLPSYVINALHKDPERAESSIRIGLGRETTTSEIKKCTDKLTAVIEQLRLKSLPYQMFKEQQKIDN
ncbi:hypothetical protein BVY03_03780 [bacterium K02(2017)]|nr:hypothetical protein BVY03_03780 [bacterium K02(2017)]